MSDRQSSSSQRTYDFQNVLDISNNQKIKSKDKNNNFEYTNTNKEQSSQGFDFQDFRNLGDDKTQKSDNKTSQKWTSSDLMKKSFQSNLVSQGLGVGNNKNNIKQKDVYFYQPASGTTQNFNSPKFVELSDRQSSQNFVRSQNQFLANLNNNNGNGDQVKYMQLKQNKGQYSGQSQNYVSSSKINSTLMQREKDKSNSFSNNLRNNNSHQNYNNNSSLSKQKQKKQKSEKIKEIQEYQSLCDQISFYNQASQNLSFEGRKIRTNTEDLTNKLALHLQNSQFHRYSSQITKLNQEIQRQKSIEKRLGTVCQELQEQYQQLINSVTMMNFARPKVLTAQTKIILQQINTLKAQFEALNRDDASLNFSTTNLNSQLNINKFSSKYNINGGSSIIKAASNSNSNSNNNFFINYDQILKQILQQDKKSDDPKFLYNLKMSCLKDQWIIYNNSIIRIHASYRINGMIKLTIGNKNTLDLNKFSIFEQGISVVQGQILSAKSYYLHQIPVKKYQKKKPFLCIKIKYILNFQIPVLLNKSNKSLNNNQSSLGKHQQITFFIPNMSLKYGQFIPFTKKQLQNEISLQLPQITGSYRPIDKSIISNISQMQLFIPNLILDNNNKFQFQSHSIANNNQKKQRKSAYGIFRSNQSNGSIVNIKQKDDLIRFWIKNGDTGLLKFLQFVFTV